jgi:hypothetical protein
MDTPDKRGHPRTPARGEVSGKIHNFEDAQVIDLSRSGALLGVVHAPSIGSIYPLRLSFSDLPPLQLNAEVVRCEASETHSSDKGELAIVYRVGVRFRALSKFQEAVIKEITTRVGKSSVQGSLSMDELDNDLVGTPDAPFTTPET